MSVDLVIRHGKVVTPHGILEAALAIDEGKIVSIGGERFLPSARRTVDVDGNYILPGVIDPHVHFQHWERPFKDDCKTETRAAAAGGNTTIGVYLLLEAGKDFVKMVNEYKQTYNENAMVDSFFHIIEPNMSNSTILRGPSVGITSFKLTQGRFRHSDGVLFRALEQISKLGPNVRAMVHCENLEIISFLTERIQKEGREGLVAVNEARPAFCEAEYIQRILYMAKVTRCPLYIVHVTSGESCEVLARGKAEGINVVAEVCTPYLTHSNQSKGIFEEKPFCAYEQPPLRPPKDIEKLWEAIDSGVISTVGSDHAPRTLEEKLRRDVLSTIGEGKKVISAEHVSMWDGAPGMGNITETVLPVMLSEGVNKERISLEKVAELCSYNVARVFGLYPRKGVIQVGSDADLVVVDLAKRVKISPGSAAFYHSRVDYSIYDGWEMQGWPVLTLVRGKEVMRDGEIVGEPGHGKYLPR